MTPEQQFILLANEMEKVLHTLYGEGGLHERLTAAMMAVGVGNYAQDLNTGAVYKVVKPQGTFIYYRDIDYKRTALDGERGGNVLSKKEAEGAGFVLSK